MKKISKVLFSFMTMICLFCTSLIPYQIHANPTEEEVGSVLKATEISVPADISEEALEQRINDTFAQTGAEVVITNYIDDNNSINPFAGSNYVENKRSFSFLSYWYTIDIIVGGYIVGGYSVSGFNCKTSVSNSIIVVNKIYYQNPTTLQATAIVYFTLNGEVPHTYKCVAPLQGTIYLES